MPSSHEAQGDEVGWLRGNLPAGADDAPAVCMGDSRLANALIVGSEVRALVDFEVAYIGNPAADIGYSVSFDAMHRRNADPALPGFPSSDETWTRWAAATGRSIEHRDYWTAFGATVLHVTAARAMRQFDMPPESVESVSLVEQWEATVERAT